MAWKSRRSVMEAFAEGMLKAGALRFGTFTLSDGRESPYYLELRGLLSYPGLYQLSVDSMSKLVASKAPKAKAICGVAVGGLALAGPVALSLKKPLMYSSRPTGSEGRTINGEVRPDWTVAVLDDLTASGRTILATARAIEEDGGEASDAFVLIDRMEGARERLSKQGIALHSLTDVVEMADTLLSMELISDGDMKAIAKSAGRRQ